MTYIDQSMFSPGLSTECKNILTVSGLNASSEKDSHEHGMSSSSRNMDSSHEFLHWAADSSDTQPWVELGLRERNTITGWSSV